MDGKLVLLNSNSDYKEVSCFEVVKSSFQMFALCNQIKEWPQYKTGKILSHKGSRRISKGHI